MQPDKTLRILYIEDDISSRLLVRKLLNRSPFAFYEASTGLQGLQMATSVHPDLILMDINLPDITGNELTTKIKSTGELRDIIVVALTGQEDPDAREMTLVAGCDGFIRKPIEVDSFAQQILQFLRGKKESVEEDKWDFYRRKYEKTLVDHLTTKVQELEESNQKLEETTEELQIYNESLEKIISISSRLQTCLTPKNLKKILVDEICENFEYDRCAFIDVDTEKMVLRPNYARGFEASAWENIVYPFESAFFRKLFKEKQAVYVPSLERIEDGVLRSLLQTVGTTEFIFGYLGTKMNPSVSTELREGMLPFIRSDLPSLYGQAESDDEVILDHLQEYLSSEALYRGGFLFIDNIKPRKRPVSQNLRFLETFLKTTSYIYQNQLLMEELRYLFIRAEKEAITDPLTNLFNYRYFVQQLQREINRSRRHSSRFSLIMIDIDHFKQYNDTFGHQAGDIVLRRISRLMLHNTRSSDVVARYGGEEFMIICPELDKDGAKKMAEKLRQIVENSKFPLAEKTPEGLLSISLGVATFPDDSDTAFSLIKKTDQALYKAKAAGRNQVCSALVS